MWYFGSKYYNLPAEAICSLVFIGWNPTNGTCIDNINPIMKNDVYAAKKKKKDIVQLNSYQQTSKYINVSNTPPVITSVLSLSAFHGDVYSIQHYVIKFVTGQLISLGTPVSSTNKTEILLNMAINTLKGHYQPNRKFLLPIKTIRYD